MLQKDFIQAAIEKKKVGRTIVEFIEARSNLPNESTLKVHNQYFNGLDESTKFKLEQATKTSIKKVREYFDIVDKNFLNSVPESAWCVYITSFAQAKAQNTYEKNGSCYITLEINNLYCDKVEEITHYLIHEFLHLFRFRQINNSSVDLIANRLRVYYSNIQIGYCFHSIKNYVLADISNTEWYFIEKIINSKNRDFIQVIKDSEYLEMDVYLKVELSNVLAADQYSNVCKLKSLNTIITMFEDLFGQNWLENPEFILFIKPKLPFLIKKNSSRTICKDVYYNPEQNSYDFCFKKFNSHLNTFNEIENEFTTRIVGLSSILDPQDGELDWYNQNGGYTDLKTINLLCDLYLNLKDQKTRKYFLQELYKFQIECDPIKLLNFIKTNFINSTVSSHIYQNLKKILI